MPFAFEEFVLDADRRELRRGGDPVAIEPKVFDLLVHLVANRERVVTKDDLIGAVWDGRIVSDSALTTAVNAARVALGDSGGAQRLIKTLPRKGFRFVADVREHEAAGTAATGVATAAPKVSLALPDRPSLAVLPFTNIGDDPQQDYFADGIVEEIITALSRIRSLFVIARNSSFTYKGRAVDVKQVGRELGVRYVLEGSVRRAGGQVRISGHLIDALTGVHLWADRFDGTLENIFDLQDQVAKNVVGAIGSKMQQAEIARAKRKPTENLDAYDYFLRGMSLTHQGPIGEEGNSEALRLFYKAIELDPEVSLPYAMAARCYAVRRANGWTTDQEKEIVETERLGRRGAALGRDNAVSLCFAGHSLAYVVGELEDAVAFIDQARALNPSLVSAWYFSGWTRIWLGEHELAIEHLAYAMRLSPLDPFIWEAPFTAIAANHRTGK